MERNLERFQSVYTQVLGISVDSRYCHAGWANSLGGISFPLLADFHPKGAVAQKYGLYLEEAGITDRATVIIDAAGVVQHASSVTPSGERNIDTLVGACETMHSKHDQKLPEFAAPPGIEPNSVLYVKGGCGFSNWALQARDNLHLRDTLPVKNVSDDPVALKDLEQVTGKQQAPCLVVNGEPIFESDAIIAHLAGRCRAEPGR